MAVEELVASLKGVRDAREGLQSIESAAGGVGDSMKSVTSLVSGVNSALSALSVTLSSVEALTGAVGKENEELVRDLTQSVAFLQSALEGLELLPLGAGRALASGVTGALSGGFVGPQGLVSSRLAGGGKELAARLAGKSVQSGTPILSAAAGAAGTSGVGTAVAGAAGAIGLQALILFIVSKQMESFEARFDEIFPSLKKARDDLDRIKPVVEKLKKKAADEKAREEVFGIISDMIGVDDHIKRTPLGTHSSIITNRREVVKMRALAAAKQTEDRLARVLNEINSSEMVD